MKETCTAGTTTSSLSKEEDTKEKRMPGTSTSCIASGKAMKVKPFARRYKKIVHAGYKYQNPVQKRKHKRKPTERRRRYNRNLHARNNHRQPTVQHIRRTYEIKVSSTYRTNKAQKNRARRVQFSTKQIRDKSVRQVEAAYRTRN